LELLRRTADQVGNTVERATSDGDIERRGGHRATGT
jgi:hypothetical protein